MKAKGKVLIAKSIIVFDVKVYEQDEDFKRIHGLIMAKEFDGLIWNKDFKLAPIAYGM